jgi:tRNA threonylcarbamoyladenosine biosynthesis protein TsaB
VKILGIDTATSQVGVAIGDADAVIGELRIAGDRRHAEQLVPAIRSLCETTGVRLDQLAAIGVGIGPGLFTGLRVGVTTAKVMAQALRIPVVPVPSLDLIAYPLRHTQRLVVTVVDARRHEVFSARYQPVPGGVQRDGDYQVGSVPELVADLVARREEVLLAGNGVVRFRDELDGLDRVELADAEFAEPSVGALVELAAAKMEREEFSSPFDVTPLYLRQSDAELAWPHPAHAGATEGSTGS